MLLNNNPSTPKKGRGERRVKRAASSKVVPIRMTTEEHHAVMEWGKKHGLNTSEVIRSCLVNHDVLPSPKVVSICDEAILAEMRKVGGLLVVGLAIRKNSNPLDAARLREALSLLYGTIKQITGKIEEPNR